MNQLPTELTTEIFNLRYKLIRLDFMTNLKPVHKALNDPKVLRKMKTRKQQFEIYNTYWPQAIIITGELLFSKNDIINTNLTTKNHDWADYILSCKIRGNSHYKQHNVK